MGVYAQTNFAITCTDNKTAKRVAKILRTQGDVESGNMYGRDIKTIGNDVFGFADSGRIQNLEFQCRAIWDAVQNLDGVLEGNFPFLSEADGLYFERDN